jgi:hypothetical protein
MANMYFFRVSSFINFQKKYAGTTAFRSCFLRLPFIGENSPGRPGLPFALPSPRDVGGSATSFSLFSLVENQAEVG